MTRSPPRGRAHHRARDLHCRKHRHHQPGQARQLRERDAVGEDPGVGVSRAQPADRDARPGQLEPEAAQRRDQTGLSGRVAGAAAVRDQRRERSDRGECRRHGLAKVREDGLRGGEHAE
jgi:hypothetical protein